MLRHYEPPPLIISMAAAAVIEPRNYACCFADFRYLIEARAIAMIHATLRQPCFIAAAAIC